MPLTIHRVARMRHTTKTPVIPAAAYGWCVANHVNPIAPTSSPTLSSAFETGSGDGVTNVLAANLLECEISANPPPIAAASACDSGDRCCVAPYANNAPIGTRMNVCNAFQKRSKTGILSAKNSITNITLETTITHHSELTCSDSDSGSTPVCAWMPGIARVE